jgi:hypothetical protein
MQIGRFHTIEDQVDAGVAHVLEVEVKVDHVLEAEVTVDPMTSSGGLTTKETSIETIMNFACETAQ